MDTCQMATPKKNDLSRFSIINATRIDAAHGQVDSMHQKDHGSHDAELSMERYILHETATNRAKHTDPKGECYQRESKPLV